MPSATFKKKTDAALDRKRVTDTAIDTASIRLPETSSVYDAYNHLTFASHQKRLTPRRQLELIAGGLLATS
ncbi:hypothetical protein [Alicyclobacillus sp. ALC3]|uniref:hypothetical protein n=1 Tax=Alicyclobacillus sp. ALC3 TaxID=2796143 RepID=UPI00237A010F|nr:hypothetical protein [Alicyclobacillus sp. ALC3]WDL98462.1 hypothetical protein JC200_07200 [Alicyclobacillus sp. ALC3]